MKKLCVLGLLLALVFAFTLIYAQQPPMMDFQKQQEEYLKSLQKDSPKLYEFEKRLLDIQKQMQQIFTDFQNGKITKEQVRSLATPLLKEEMEIRNNPEYQIEQRLMMIISMSRQMPQGRQAPPKQ
jgi:hypothetical protein